MIVRTSGSLGRDVYPGPVSWIDVAIVALVVIAGLRGWVVGLLRQLGSFVGRIVGFGVGCYVAVAEAPHVTAIAWRPLDVILIIAVCTVAGGLIMRFFGGIFSARLHEGRLGLADSVLGASVGVAGMLVTCWLVAAILAVVPWSSVGQSINKSLILKTLQHVLPTPPAVESRLQGVLSQLNIPSLFANVVAPTPPTLAHGKLTTRHHVSSPEAVLLVRASGGCGLTNQATGFLVSTHEVVTVAHLLAGETTVTVAGRLARVVFFDPRSDLAVLRTAQTRTTPLALAASAPSTTLATVVGYQNATDRTSTRAVLAGAVSAPGRDIFSRGVFTRTMQVVAAPLTASEDGAPVLVNGSVVAVVADRTAVDSSLVYAVPLEQLREALLRVSSTPVSTQRCVN